MKIRPVFVLFLLVLLLFVFVLLESLLLPFTIIFLFAKTILVLAPGFAVLIIRLAPNYNICASMNVPPVTLQEAKGVVATSTPVKALSGTNDDCGEHV